MPDDADRASDMAAWEEYAQKREIEKIRTHQRRSFIRNCKDCDEPIPKARKKAYPSATRCIFCQEQYENYRNR